MKEICQGCKNDGVTMSLFRTATTRFRSCFEIRCEDGYGRIAKARYNPFRVTRSRAYGPRVAQARNPWAE